MGGDDEREVMGELELSGWPEAEDEAGLAARSLWPSDPEPADRGSGTGEILGIRFPIIPLSSLARRCPLIIPAVLGSRAGKRLPIIPPELPETFLPPA